MPDLNYSSTLSKSMAARPPPDKPGAGRIFHPSTLQLQPASTQALQEKRFSEYLRPANMPEMNSLVSRPPQ
jgi:hypothetical protein